MLFEKEALQNCKSISVHWSSDCNMACQYCYIDKDKKAMHAYNLKIREAIKDGTFLNHIKNTFLPYVDEIEHLSLWGAEPTINGDLFPQFINSMLDAFPKIKEFMFSTNALVGWESLYNNFCIPLIDYAETKQRPLHWEVQFSLDGPPEFNDVSRHPGATSNTLHTAFTLMEKIPKNCKYFSLSVITKATLDISYMRLMNQEGLSKFQWYYDFMNQIQETGEKIARDNPAITSVQMFGVPTVVDPGYYTKEDGEEFAIWINNLNGVKRDKWSGKSLHIPLFFQGANQIFDFKRIQNPSNESYHCFSCSAGKNGYTIDCDGTVYSCNRLCRNAALSDEHKFKHVMKANSTIDNPTDKKWLRRNYALQVYHENLHGRYMLAEGIMLSLANSNQIKKEYLTDEHKRLVLFYLISGVYCHVGSEEDFTGSPYVIQAGFFRLFGNGAQEALENYCRNEIKKGVLKV